MKKQVTEILNKSAAELTGSEIASSLENLHINFDYDYKKSLSIIASGALVDGGDTYTCELSIKLNKVQA